MNNAGAIPGGDQTIDEQRWRDAWNLKVFGYINLCRAVYPVMKARGGGVIVNVLGAAGERPTWGYIAGSAGNALFGLHPRHGRHQPGRQDPHRRLQSRPDQHRAHGDDAARDGCDQARRCRALARAHPHQPPVGTPEQCADLVAFLASERASHIAGTVVTIDGGAAHYAGVL